MILQKRHFKFAAVALLVVLLAVFIVQNVAVVELKFLFWSIAMRRSIMILSVFAIGFLAAWLIRGYLSHREIKRLYEGQTRTNVNT